MVRLLVRFDTVYCLRAQSLELQFICSQFYSRFVLPKCLPSSTETIAKDKNQMSTTSGLSSYPNSSTTLPNWRLLFIITTDQITVNPTIISSTIDTVLFVFKGLKEMPQANGQIRGRRYSLPSMPSNVARTGGRFVFWLCVCLFSCLFVCFNSVWLISVFEYIVDYRYENCLFNVMVKYINGAEKMFIYFY